MRMIVMGWLAREAAWKIAQLLWAVMVLAVCAAIGAMFAIALEG